MNKDRYIAEIWKRIGEKIETSYGTRRAVVISIAAPIILNSIVYLVLFRVWGADAANQQIVSYVIGSLGLEVVLLGLFLFFARYYDTPQEIYSDQVKIIEKNQQQIYGYEFLERFATANSIKLKSAITSFVGIEICNNEERTAFEGQLFVTWVSGKRKINPSKVKVGHSSQTVFTVPPREGVIGRFIEINSDMPMLQLDDEINYLDFPQSGEYTITTRVAGKFLHTEKDVLASFKSEWKFIVNREFRIFDLVLVKERLD